MKKIVILCAAVALAAVTQAATVNWTITNSFGTDGSTKLAKGSAMAYLFVTSNTTDVKDLTTTTLADVQGALKGGDLTKLSSLAAVSKVNNVDGGWTGATGLTGFSSGSFSAFAVVIDSSDPASAANYFFVGGGDEKTATFASATGMQMLSWGDQTKITQAAGAWTSTSGGVPEPTSGMLLLLGVAGLALRRKQK